MIFKGVTVIELEMTYDGRVNVTYEVIRKVGISITRDTITVPCEDNDFPVIGEVRTLEIVSKRLH